MAAPTATTSSGLTPFDGFLPKNFSTSFWITGILVDPPTKITSLISDLFNPASFNAFLTGSIDLLTRSEHNCSNLDLVNVLTKCFGPESVAVIYGKFISVCVDDESSILAFSAASLSLCNAIGSFLKSILSCSSYSKANH